MTDPRPGLVSLVGAGPGDPGLLTRRGFERLMTADVVVYDHLVGSGILDEGSDEWISLSSPLPLPF